MHIEKAYIYKTYLFHNGGPYHTETSPLIYSANQWTGFLYDRDLRHERVKRKAQLISKFNFGL